MSERGASTALLIANAVALTIRAAVTVAKSVVRFMVVARFLGGVRAFRRVLTRAGFVTMMALVPAPICRRARTRDGVSADTAVR
jgi:hypothetical protein